MKTKYKNIYLLFIWISASALTTEAIAQDYVCLSHADTSLSKYFGRWSVKWRYRSSPGEYVDTDSISAIETGLNGCALKETFEGMRGDEHYFFEWTLTKRENGNYSGVWFDSSHGDFLKYSHLEGTRQWPIQLVWTHMNGRLQTRLRYSEIKNDQFSIVRHLSTNGGKDWVLTSRAEYQPSQNGSNMNPK